MIFQYTNFSKPGSNGMATNLDDRFPAEIHGFLRNPEP